MTGTARKKRLYALVGVLLAALGYAGFLCAVDRYERRRHRSRLTTLETEEWLDQRVRGHVSEDDLQRATLRVRSHTYFGGRWEEWEYAGGSVAYRVCPGPHDRAVREKRLTLDDPQRALVADVVNLVAREKLWEQSDVLPPAGLHAADGGEDVYEFSVAARAGLFKVVNTDPKHLRLFRRKCWRLMLLFAKSADLRVEPPPPGLNRASGAAASRPAGIPPMPHGFEVFQLYEANRLEEARKALLALVEADLSAVKANRSSKPADIMLKLGVQETAAVVTRCFYMDLMRRMRFGVPQELFEASRMALEAVDLALADAQAAGPEVLAAMSWGPQRVQRAGEQRALLADREKTARARTPGRHMPSKQFYETMSVLHKRVNGVLMSATVTARAETAIVTWTLDYDGPRPPVTVIRPSLTFNCGQTELVVYAVGKNGEVHEQRLRSPIPAGKYFSREDWFVTVEKGGHTSGEITLSVPEAQAFYVKHWPERFEGTTPKLHLQLVHKPRDRGETHGFDAWTGELYSRVLEVPSPSDQ